MEAKQRQKSINQNYNIKIEKVVVNIGLKETGEIVEKAYNLLKKLSNSKPVRTKATRAARTFRVRRGLNIGVKTTLRGEKALYFLRKTLKATENNLKKSSFDDYGNISFGLKEHLDIPEEKFDPEIGIFGLNITTTLKRSGYRIRRRKTKTKKIPKSIKIKKEDAMKFFTDEFRVKIIN
ncbi:MAG: 50S ribosomal protein L5 [Candidatus Aenigmarchaeota archaeon ex4484_52]|nr:MAG: 50S ribosomal protein L5 [Candidatus Aenigmarchaeota archaeon ex4484_52]